MQTAIMYIVITALMAPVLLGFAVPFLAAAFIAYRAARTSLSYDKRVALASAIAALGIAPSYDDYGGPLPIFVRLVRGETVAPAAAIVSVAATLAVVLVLARRMSRQRAVTA